MAVKHHEGETETLDSSTLRNTWKSSSLWGICPPILALPDGLVKTTTTTTFDVLTRFFTAGEII